MKKMLIPSCLLCPYRFNFGSILSNYEGQTCLYKNINKKLIDLNNIPDWCELDNE